MLRLCSSFPEVWFTQPTILPLSVCSLMSFRQYIPLCSHSHHHIGKHSVSTKPLFVVSACCPSRQPWPAPSFTSSNFISIALPHMRVCCVYLSWSSPSFFFPSYYFFITCILLLNENQRLPRLFSALDSTLPVQGAQVPSLVRELESHMPRGAHPHRTNHSAL